MLALELRGHSIEHSALTAIILAGVEISNDEDVFLSELLGKVADEKSMNEVEVNKLKLIRDKFEERLRKFELQGPTSKFWVQYYDMFMILKQFIQAERSGNWSLHIECTRRMIPYFHASGHYLYAKTAHLHVQQMLELKETMDPLEYKKFTELGYFTVRQTNKFWCGIWTDMAIEQRLNRLFKINSGPARGRGVCESQLAKFVARGILLIDVLNKIEEFCNTESASSYQHVDAKPKRVKRDDDDTFKIIQFFKNHNPFPNHNSLVSITSGLKADTTIYKCHEAFEVGMLLMEKAIDNNFGQFKYSRKDKVLPFQAVSSKVKVKDNVIPISPTLIFQRISLLIKEN